MFYIEPNSGNFIIHLAPNTPRLKYRHLFQVCQQLGMVQLSLRHGWYFTPCPTGLHLNSKCEISGDCMECEGQKQHVSDCPVLPCATPTLSLPDSLFCKCFLMGCFPFGGKM